MKTLAVIGASYLQLPLVRKAKQMGLRVICFAWPEGAICADACDVFYPISIIEKEKILEICQNERADGVTSIATDVAVPTISYVAQNMGLVSNSIESAAKSTNKYLMRQALWKAGVPCPKFIVVGEGEDISSQIDKMSFPLVVKPADRSGSMGVTRIDRMEDLDQAVAAAIGDSFCHKAIVEECITDMREISVEGISWKGGYHLIQITDKVTTGAPHYVELAHHQPAHLSDELQIQITDIVKKCVSALDVHYGATHAELMITSDSRVYVTEIGARMGGDFIGSDLVWLSTGYDFLEGVVKCALGEFDGIRLSAHAKFSGVWFYAPQTSWVRDVIEGHMASPNVEIVRVELQRDDVMPLTRSADRSGYFIYKSDEGRFNPQGVRNE